MIEPKDILVDFDGTVVTHDFPRIGHDIGAVPVLKELVYVGHRLILFTMRSDVTDPQSNNPLSINEPGDYLTQAVNWFKQHEIPLYGIQTNPTQHTWSSSPKAYGQLILDDIALGIPLTRKVGERPYVNWVEVRKLLEQQGYLPYVLELRYKKKVKSYKAITHEPYGVVLAYLNKERDFLDIVHEWECEPHPFTDETRVLRNGMILARNKSPRTSKDNRAFKGEKAVDPATRNHGSDHYSRNNRLYKFLKKEQAANELMNDL
jgi:hypothetical protein